MKFLCALAASTAALGVVAPSFATPLGGGTPQAQVWKGVVDYVDSSATCPAFQIGSQQNGLTAITRGWGGTPFISNGAYVQQLRQTADVSGTITDAAGNAYQVTGHFTDVSVRQINELKFDGSGQLSVAGAGGTVAGVATMRIVAGPPELDVTFTNTPACTVK